MNFFSKTNPWFSACFKFLMSIIYLVLSCNLATSFSTFSIFILSGKNGKSWWSSCKFSRYWKSASLKYPLSLSSFYIFMKFSLNWEVSLMRSKLIIGRFCDIAQPYKLFNPNIEDMMILSFYENLSCICYYLLHINK